MSDVLLLDAGRGTDVAYDADAVTYWGSHAATLTTSRKTLDNQLFTDLKAAGLFSDMFDFMYIFAHEIQALSYRNLIKRAHDCTDGVAPTWTQNRGVQGNGTTQYILTNYQPLTQKTNFALNSGTLLVYNRTEQARVEVEIGCQAGLNTQRLDFFCRLSSNVLGGAINASSSTGVTSVTQSTGLVGVSRTASNVTINYRNGVALGSTDTTVSTGINNVNMTILARSSAGTAQTPSSRQIAFACCGAGMSGSQMATLYTIIQAYMTAIGANV